MQLGQRLGGHNCGALKDGYRLIGLFVWLFVCLLACLFVCSLDCLLACLLTCVLFERKRRGVG